MRDVAIENRKCRYSDENTLEVYKRYSYSACIVQCRKDAMLRICNCTHHLMPNTGKLNDPTLIANLSYNIWLELHYFGPDSILVANVSCNFFLEPRLHCNMEGIQCLNNNYNELAVIKAAWSTKTGLNCNCIPSCTETELYVVKDERKS